MALALAIRHWRPYLIGRKFIVHTDQCNLRHLLDQSITTPAQQQWLAKLLGYKFLIVYKLGASNKTTDALFRREEEMERQILTIPVWLGLDRLNLEVQEDKELQKILTDLAEDPNTTSHSYGNLGRHLHGRYYKSSKIAWFGLYTGCD